MSDELRPIVTDGAPAAIGPYTQAIVDGHLVFTSGQVALDPKSGALIDGGIEDQTRRVLRNLAAVLEAAGSSLHRAIRCTVYLKDMQDFAAMNKVYAEFFATPYPARSTVAVAALPRGALVEIDVVARR